MVVSELHTIDPERIDPDAAKVVRRLTRYGHEAFLVGGCVRDLLCGWQPKDFDVSTSATPVEIRKLFRNCRIIGRRFRLAHIFFGEKIIETSTFRAMPRPEEAATEGAPAERPELMIRRDNTFGSQEEDARRRDFTVNGLFYDLVRGQVIDHVDGLDDLRGRRIRTIGDPRVRFQEDPVRILRAVKFAARLGFSIEDATERAMMEFRSLIAECSPARVLEEIYRLLGCGHSEEAVRLMQRTGVLAVLLPELQALLSPPPSALARALVAPIRAVGSNPSLSLDDLARDVEPEFVRVPRDATAAGAAPAAAEDAGSEALPTKEPRPRPSPEEERLAVEHLLRILFRDDPRGRERAATWLWGHLRAMDEWLGGPRLLAGDGTAPTDCTAHAPSATTPPSHALLLGNALYGLGARSLDRELDGLEAQNLLEALIQGAAVRLGVSRKDRERLLQLLLMQRRLLNPGRRSRPLSLARRELFSEAFRLLELHHQGVGEHAEAVERWQRLLRGDGAPTGGGRKRRRRRGRRGRRDGEAPGEAPSGPSRAEPRQGS